MELQPGKLRKITGGVHVRKLLRRSLNEQQRLRVLSYDGGAAAVAIEREQLVKISRREDAGIAAHAAVGERSDSLRLRQPCVDEC